MALSILPHLMTTAAKKQGVTDEIVILTATSGDTGKAALSGFADVEGTRIIVFYPKGGVSEVQRLQMVTQKGKNTAVVAIHGNFDEAQSGVKRMFEDPKLREELREAGFRFSSANSINIGRLVPQIDLRDAGAASIMPLGAPIGSNKGLATRDFIKIIIDEIALPVIVDAGIGRPSQACEAMEMGAAAVMANTAIATAGDIPLMAAAFKQAVEAGRAAYLAGPGRVLEQGAAASSPLTGFLEDR